MIGWVALFLVVPLLVLALAQRVPALRALSPVVLCYGCGLAWANLLPTRLPPGELTHGAAGAGVVLGVPLLLLSCDLVGWWRGARVVVLSTALGFTSVALVVLASALFFVVHVPQGWKVAGMLVGTYTGSAPNMAAVGAALNVPANTLVLVTAADLVVAGCYALFLLSPGVALFARWLPPHPDPDRAATDAAPAARPTAREWAGASALGLAIAGLGVAASQQVEQQELAAILTVTTVAVLASLHPRVRSNRATYPLGDYWLLVFCLAVGSLCDLRLLWTSSGWILAWTTVVLVGSVGLHLLLCRWFRIDRDTFVVTSAAAIFTPAFIGPVASNLRNRNVLLSGLSAALVGIALGNYLGLAVAYAARALRTVNLPA